MGLFFRIHLQGHSDRHPGKDELRPPESGVAILPGSAFGLNGDNILARLAFVDFDGARALQAFADLTDEAELDEAFLLTHCERVTTGVVRICDWLHS